MDEREKRRIVTIEAEIRNKWVRKKEGRRDKRKGERKERRKEEK